MKKNVDAILKISVLCCLTVMYSRGQKQVAVLDPAHCAEPSTHTQFCPRTARAGVPFSISQPGEDAVPPDTAERRHSLPLQACPDRLTPKATPARPGCGTP